MHSTAPPPAGGNRSAPETPRPLSPLHAFLGIDPVTGEFKPPNAPVAKAPAQTAATSARQADPQQANTPQPTLPASTTDGKPVANGATLEELISRAAETGQLPPGDTRIGDTTFDELRGQVTKAVEQHDEQALSAVLRSGGHRRRQ